MRSLQKELEKSHTRDVYPSSSLPNNNQGRKLGKSSSSSSSKNEIQGQGRRKSKTSKTRSPKIVISTTPVSTPDYNDNDDDSSASSSSSSSDDDNGGDEDMMKIRKQAFDVLNKSSGHIPTNEESNSFISSYQQQQKINHQQRQQQQSTGENSSNYNNTYSSSSYQSANPHHMHNSNNANNTHYTSSAAARTANEISMTDLIVNCISDVCRSSSSELFTKSFTLVSSGYKSMSNYGDHQTVNGTFDSIDTSSHGYGNNSTNNNNNNMTTTNNNRRRDSGSGFSTGLYTYPTRYQD